MDKNQRREVQYERKHYKHYDKKYPNFSGTFARGDCTNWASQDRLHAAGGMTSRDKHARKHFGSGNRISTKHSKWYCRHAKSTLFGLRKHWNYSTSWTTVKGFYKYWAGTKHRPHFVTSSFRRVMAHVRVGDVIQLHSKKDGWHHTVTVSKVAKHMVYYTSHNKNRLFAPLTKIKSLTGLAKTNKIRVIEMWI